MQQQTVVLIGFGVGLFLTVIAQSIFPSTLFLSESSFGFYLDPEAGIIVYLTIPLTIGTVVALINRPKAGENGLISGTLTGVVNLSIVSLRYYPNLGSQERSELSLFALMLTLLWAFLAACAAKATAWSLENPSIRPAAKQIPDRL